MTDCTSERFSFQAPGRRSIDAAFDGGEISGDGGAVLLHAVEQKQRIVERFAACFTDYRDPTRCEHTIEQLARPRVFALALGYEDLNDHDELLGDPLLASVAGKSTLHRLEWAMAGDGAEDRYRRFDEQIYCAHAYRQLST